MASTVSIRKLILATGRHNVGRPHPLNNSLGTSSSSRPRRYGPPNRCFSLGLTRCAGPISVDGLVDYFRLLVRVDSQYLSADHRSLITSLASLSEQADASDGLQLNGLLRYEADPPNSRRVWTGSWNPVRQLVAGPETNRDNWMVDSTNNHIEQEVHQHETGILSLSYIITMDHELCTHNPNQSDDIKPQEHVITCTGFLIESQDSKERILATCAHTLWQSNTILSKALENASLISSSHNKRMVRSGCLARDELGNVFMVSQVIGALASADLLLFRLIKLPSTPTRLPSKRVVEEEDAKIDALLVNSLSDLSAVSQHQHHALNTLAPLLTLPVSPYPPSLSSPIWIPQLVNSDSVHSLFNWESGRVIEYKDTMGMKAAPGSYDPLNTMLVSVVPTHGSSGGPIVNENGTVVGMVRGFQSAYDQRKAVGFGTVSERFWELFQLPGLPSSSYH